MDTPKISQGTPENTAIPTQLRAETMAYAVQGGVYNLAADLSHR